MPIFRVKSVKIYTGQKKFTLTPSVASVTIIRYASHPSLTTSFFHSTTTLRLQLRRGSSTTAAIVESVSTSASTTMVATASMMSMTTFVLSASCAKMSDTHSQGSLHQRDLILVAKHHSKPCSRLDVLAIKCCHSSFPNKY